MHTSAHYLLYTLGQAENGAWQLLFGIVIG